MIRRKLEGGLPLHVQDFLLGAASDDGADARVIMLLHAAMGDGRSFTTKKAMGVAKRTPALLDALEGADVRSEMELGWRLRALWNGGVTAGVRVERGRKAREGRYWRLLRTSLEMCAPVDTVTNDRDGRDSDDIRPGDPAAGIAAVPAGRTARGRRVARGA